MEKEKEHEENKNNSILSTCYSDMVFKSDIQFNYENPSFLLTSAKKFDTASTLAYCKECGITSYTNIEKSFSCFSLLCGLSTCLLGWVIYNCINKKSQSCYNAKHFCPECGNLISEYKA